MPINFCLKQRHGHSVHLTAIERIKIRHFHRFFLFFQRIFSTQNRYSNQDKCGTTSEFYADFKSAHRFLFG
jgi:hypothetical protein